jgi:hypothetical protein
MKPEPKQELSRKKHQQQTVVLDALSVKLEAMIRMYSKSQQQHELLAQLVVVPAICCGGVASIILMVLQMSEWQPEKLVFGFVLVTILSALNVLLLAISSEFKLEACAEANHSARVRTEKVQIYIFLVSFYCPFLACADSGESPAGSQPEAGDFGLSLRTPHRGSESRVQRS